MKISGRTWPNSLLRWGFVAIATFPLLAGLVYAALYSVGLAGALSDGFTWRHWQALWAEGVLWQTLGFSLYIAVVSIALSWLGALWLVWLSRGRLQKGVLGYLLFLPLGIPAIAAAFFIFQWLGSTGWLSRLADQIGLIQQPQDFPNWVNDPFGIGILAAHILLALPFFTLLLANIYRQERLSALIVLGQTLGASTYQQVRRIVIPLLWQRSRPVVLVYLLFVLGSYEIPLLLGRSHPEMVSVFVIRKLQRFSLDTIPQGMAMAVLYVVLVLLALFLFYRKRRVI